MAQHGLKPGALLKGATYRIEKVLGQGSFGITYLATAKFTTQGNLGKMDVEAKVAIKEFFMSEVNGRSEDGSTVEGSTGSVFSNYRKKFKKEAENLSKLEHPGIVKVFDVFDENNTTYYVMEFLEGENLDDYIRQCGFIEESEAIGIITEIGDALSYMHSKKMLHLDIKPKNIMRKTDGRNYLIDFGLSKQFTDDGEPESSTSIGLGTPGYAPIEQTGYKGEGEFPATLDVYALGATLYKMLTGNPSFDVASALWGNDWKMPSADDTEELVKYCKWTWINYRASTGYKITGPNGKSIFLPAKGWKEGPEIKYSGQHGIIWTSTPADDVTYGSYSLNFYKGGGDNIENRYYLYRKIGANVRPITR